MAMCDTRKSTSISFLTNPLPVCENRFMCTTSTGGSFQIFVERVALRACLQVGQFQQLEPSSV